MRRINYQLYKSRVVGVCRMISTSGCYSEFTDSTDHRASVKWQSFEHTHTHTHARIHISVDRQILKQRSTLTKCCPEMARMCPKRDKNLESLIAIHCCSTFEMLDSRLFTFAGQNSVCFRLQISVTRGSFICEREGASWLFASTWHPIDQTLVCSFSDLFLR